MPTSKPQKKYQTTAEKRREEKAEFGNLKGEFFAEKTPFGYVIRNGDRYLNSSRHNRKTFRALDSVFTECRKLGIRKFTVEIGE
jgi:hypothetical protein